MKKHHKILLTFLTACIITIALLPDILNGTPASPAVGNWYQQFMPNLGGRSITDVFFLDSLTGWAVTNATNQSTDTIFVLKTTNSGDNWTILYRKVQTGGGFSGYFKIYFLNPSTGYKTDIAGIYKTVDGGSNWSSLNAPATAYTDFSIKSIDTLWIVSSDIFIGGVYRTTNGGASWDQQLNLGSSNPEKIYMFNPRIGYISRNQGSSGYVRKTTDGGSSWNLIVNNDYYNDIFFSDSLTGWKSSVFGMKKTLNGGLNWVTQTLPQGGIISVTGISSFHNINKDTIFGVGGYVIYPNSQVRGMLYRTVDGGNTWLFQIPDTTIHIGGYSMITFTDKNNGWAYNIATGIHTTTGGDPVWLTGIEQISSEVPKEYRLYQNYPNPFNPVTNIKYQISNTGSMVKLVIFDVTGREIIKLVDKEQTAGTYKVDFSGTGLSSGIYIYTLIVNGKFTDSKKMILIK